MEEHALRAASKGWKVFPLIPGTKKPKFKNNLELATDDADQIKEWWSQWPDANIGIATGPSGLVIIDIDVPKEPLDAHKHEEMRDLYGIEAWSMLVTNYGLNKEPHSYEVDTPSGGQHIYWLANKALPIKTGTSKLAPGIDVRATNGSIVGAGSVTEQGTYEIYRDINPKALPAWLRTALGRAGLATSDAEKQVQPARRNVDVTSPDRYARGAYKSEIDQLRTTPIGVGLRNAALNRAAFKLRKYVEAGKLSATEVEDGLKAVAIDELSMNDKEVEATIKSGLGV